jgi:hypothetical protein
MVGHVVEHAVADRKGVFFIRLTRRLLNRIRGSFMSCPPVAKSNFATTVRTSCAMMTRILPKRLMYITERLILTSTTQTIRICPW